MVVRISLKIFVQAKIRGTMSAAVNLDDIIDIIHSYNINPKQSYTDK